MSEEEIELIIERRIDKLDDAYMKGRLTEKQYEEAMQELLSWEAQQYGVELPHILG